MADHVRRNRAVWDTWARDYVADGERAWTTVEPHWGIWHVPESQVGLLPDDVAGLDTVELGCGTGYVSAWLARRGARPVGLDNSRAQLTTARRLQREHDLPFPLLHGDAEHVPLRDGCADLVVSEYGASIWCDPERWIPEAARLLRPGGRLTFLVNSTLLMLCMPDADTAAAGTTLLRPYFELDRMEWSSDDSVEFHRPHGDWIRLLRRNGFELEDLIEIRPSADSSTRYPFVTLDWARRWPCEEVWKARKRAR